MGIVVVCGMDCGFSGIFCGFVHACSLLGGLNGQEEASRKLSVAMEP